MYDILNRKQWPKTTGIYKIWFNNSSTGKVYIGSSFSERGFRGRWGTHLGDLRGLKHSSIKLQNAFNKYGEIGLRFDIVELVKDTDNVIPTEQKYIDEFDSYTYGYNCSPTAGSQYGYKHRQETIDKINKTRWDKFNKFQPEVIKLYQQGKTLKEIESELGLCPHTASRILKESDIKLKNKADYTKITIHQYSKSGEFIKEWGSAYEAANTLGMKESHIRRVLKQQQLYTKGFHFSYDKLDPEDYKEKIIEYKIKNKSKYIPTVEHIEKMRKAQLKLDNPFNRITDIEQYDLDGNLLKIWKDTKEIVEFYGLKNATPVLRVIRGERNKFKNTIWKRKN